MWGDSILERWMLISSPTPVSELKSFVSFRFYGPILKQAFKWDDFRKIFENTRWIIVFCCEQSGVLVKMLKCRPISGWFVAFTQIFWVPSWSRLIMGYLAWQWSLARQTKVDYGVFVFRCSQGLLNFKKLQRIRKNLEFLFFWLNCL